MEEVSSGETYAEFIIDDDIEEYREKGVFASTSGDLVVPALANVLQRPIIVISSVVDRYIHPFIPNKGCVDATSPIYIAYETSECHYSSTYKSSTGKERMHSLTYALYFIRNFVNLPRSTTFTFCAIDL